MVGRPRNASAPASSEEQEERGRGHGLRWLAGAAMALLLLLGVLVYPWLLALGWIYVRRAEANERDFVSLVEEVER